MGLATIDPHSLKEHIEIHKIPKFGVSRPNSKQDTAILNMSKFTKKCMACQTAVQAMVHISTREGLLLVSLISAVVFFLKWIQYATLSYFRWFVSNLNE